MAHHAGIEVVMRHIVPRTVAKAHLLQLYPGTR